MIDVTESAGGRAYGVDAWGHRGRTASNHQREDSRMIRGAHLPNGPITPADAAPVTAQDVWVHYFEAANSAYVADRGMFLGDDTLRNIAVDAAAGRAFMNSRRTGPLGPRGAPLRAQLRRALRAAPAGTGRA